MSGPEKEKNNPTVLFITRSYPPITGGMETLSYNLTTSVSHLTKTYIIANTKGKKYLPIFFITAFFSALTKAKHYDVIHIGDPVLSKLGWLLKIITHKPVIMEVHGLDILYQNKFYQWYLKLFFNSADLHICISDYVEKIAKEKFGKINSVVIEPGITDDFYRPSYNKSQLQKIVGKDISDKKILTTIGRLVKRKGVVWFIENIAAKLPENTVYIIAGNGPDKEKIQNLIKQNNLSEKVIYVGKVSREQLLALYNSADLFVMPNVPITGDAEGFGLVALEASSCGTPVIASDIEGITNAVIDGKNGWLVPAENSTAFLQKISEHINDKENLRNEIRNFVLQNFNWNDIAQKYLEQFKFLI